MQAIKQPLAELASRINEQPNVQAAKQWYGALSGRDRNIVKGVALLLVLALVFVMLVLPVVEQRQTSIKKRDKALDLYELVASNAHQFGRVSSSNSTGEPILNVVTALATQQNLSLSRYERADNGLRIWLEDVAFDDAIGWLELLQQNAAIRVEQANIDRSARAGRVNVRATIVR